MLVIVLEVDVPVLVVVAVKVDDVNVTEVVVSVDVMEMVAVVDEPLVCEDDVVEVALVVLVLVAVVAVVVDVLGKWQGPEHALMISDEVNTLSKIRSVEILPWNLGLSAPPHE